MERKIVLVDMDGVIADFEKSLLGKMSALHPEVKPIYSQRTHFTLEKDYSPTDTQKFKDIYGAPGFFRGLEPISGSIDGLKNLVEINDVFICTSPLTKYKNCVEEKYEWVDHYLGTDWVKRIILTKDKTIIHGDYLIDDKPEITGIRSPAWSHLVFEAPYNLHVSKPRVNWQTYKDFITN